MGEDFRKIVWINWDTVCSKNEYGCLGVRLLREFNIVLLS